MAGSLKCGFVDHMVACELDALAPELWGDFSWCPLNPPPSFPDPSELCGGHVSSSALSRETEGQDIKLNAVNLSTKKFPGSMVVLNYLHASIIFNSGFLCFF